MQPLFCPNKRRVDEIFQDTFLSQTTKLMVFSLPFSWRETWTEMRGIQKRVLESRLFDLSTTIQLHNDTNPRKKDDIYSYFWHFLAGLSWLLTRVWHDFYQCYSTTFLVKVHFFRIHSEVRMLGMMAVKTVVFLYGDACPRTAWSLLRNVVLHVVLCILEPHLLREFIAWQKTSFFLQERQLFDLSRPSILRVLNTRCSLSDVPFKGVLSDWRRSLFFRYILMLFLQYNCLVE